MSVPALVVVAIRTTDEHVDRRLRQVLAVAATYDDPPNTVPSVYAKPSAELVQGDLDCLSHFIGKQGVADLNLHGERD